MLLPFFCFDYWYFSILRVLKLGGKTTFCGINLVMRCHHRPFSPQMCTLWRNVIRKAGSRWKINKTPASNISFSQVQLQTNTFTFNFFSVRKWFLFNGTAVTLIRAGQDILYLIIVLCVSSKFFENKEKWWQLLLIFATLRSWRRWWWFFSHASPFYLAYRGQCLCYSGKIKTSIFNGHIFTYLSN